MAGRPRRGSGEASEVTGRSATPDWVRRDAQPFAEHNKVSVIHGANSNDLVSADAADMIERLREVKGWLWLEECDGIVLDLMVRALARWRRIDNRIAELDIDDVPDRLWQQVSRESRDVRDSASKLALTAVDRAALMKDASWARALSGRTGPQLGEQGRMLRLQRGRASDDAGSD